MRKFFTSKGKTIVVLAVLLAIATVVTGLLIPSGTFGQKVTGAIMSPIQSGFASLGRGVEQIYDYLFKYESLQAENTALKEKIAQMEVDDSQAQAIARENERLTALLDLQAEHDDYQLLSAYVTAWDSSNWKPSCTIAKGTVDGLELGMCAVSHTGQVVGVISEIGLNWATITTILDPSLEISATITSSGYAGVVRGSYDFDGSLEMNYLPSDAVVKNTDLVVTSGSLLYPKGLVLGRIVDGGMDASGIGKFAILEPLADFDTLEQIFVITEYAE